MRLRTLVAHAALGLLMVGCGSTSNPVSTGTLGSPPQPELFRTLDGSENSPTQAGAAGAVLLRGTPAAYADGFSQPAGAGRLSPREISNGCCAQSQEMPEPHGRTNLLWVWGQFIDHDISLTRTGGETMPIAVPMGDPFFDPFSTGVAEIGFFRSLFDPASGTGPGNIRAHRNDLTAFLDGSMVYGSDQQRAQALRTFSGGRMKTGPGDFPPFNTSGLEMDHPQGTAPEDFLLCGDIRANENVALLSLHTLFLREHNRIAAQLAAQDPGLEDEVLYQRARKRVGALIQVITFEEFLPALLGQDALPSYQGYRADVDAGIDILFSTAAFRIGHTMISPTLPRLRADGQPIAQGHLAVRDAFFAPRLLLDEGGIDPVLRGLAASSMQKVDPHIIDDLRNFLFGPPGAGGFDLASLNMQRGRDHGLPSYNLLREHFGLERVTSYDEITDDVAMQQKLAQAFPDIDDIDPWLGLLTEDPLPGSAVGPTMRLILIEQFTRLRDGDRFYYRNDTSLFGELEELESTRLSDVVARNSGARIQADAFFRP